MPKDRPGRTVSEIWDLAAIEETEKGQILTFGERIYIPQSMRRDMIRALHGTHMWPEKMFSTVKYIWTWENMRNNIIQYCKSCTQCQEWATSKTRQQPQDIPEELQLSGPMDQLGADLFHWAGKTYLAMICYFSGYKWAKEARGDQCHPGLVQRWPWDS